MVGFIDRGDVRVASGGSRGMIRRASALRKVTKDGRQLHAG